MLTCLDPIRIDADPLQFPPCSLTSKTSLNGYIWLAIISTLKSPQVKDMAKVWVWWKMLSRTIGSCVIHHKISAACHTPYHAIRITYAWSVKHEQCHLKNDNIGITRGLIWHTYVGTLTCNTMTYQSWSIGSGTNESSMAFLNSEIPALISS